MEIVSNRIILVRLAKIMQTFTVRISFVFFLHLWCVNIFALLIFELYLLNDYLEITVTCNIKCNL